MKKLALSILCAGLTSAASAQNIEDVAQVDVLPGWRTADGTHVAALHVTLAPGWKTYWRAPGDGGIPMQLTLDGSENLAGAELQWPVPDVFYQSGLRSIGYTDGVVIPLAIAPAQTNQPVALAGRVTIGVCEEICIPMEFDLSALLPTQGARDSSIIAALVDRPDTAAEAGVQSATCRIAPSDDGMVMTTTVTLPNLSGDEEIVIEPGDPSIWVSEPDTMISSGQITAVSDLVHMQTESFSVNRSNVRITILGNGRAIDIQGCTAG